MVAPSITYGAVIPLQRKAPTKVIVSSGRAEPGRSTPAAQATAAHPHDFRIGGGLIKKHQVSWVKIPACVASSADAPVLRRRVAVPPRVGFFLNVMLCRLKRRHTEVRLLRIPCFRSTQTTSSSVKSDCLSISVSKKFACFSSGEALPPRGLAAQLPVVR